MWKRILDNLKNRRIFLGFFQATVLGLTLLMGPWLSFTMAESIIIWQLISAAFWVFMTWSAIVRYDQQERYISKKVTPYEKGTPEYVAFMKGVEVGKTAEKI